MAEQIFYKNNEVYQKNLKRQQKMISAKAESFANAAIEVAGDTSVEEYAKMLTRAAVGIQANRIQNIVAEQNTTVFGNKKKDLSVNGKGDASLLNAYQEFFQATLHGISNKKESIEFMKETVNSAQTFHINNKSRGTEMMSLSDIKGAWDQMKNGKYVVFDFETFGGENKAGVQTLDQLTEYAFDFYDKLGEKSSKQVEGIVGFGSNKAESLIKKYIGDADKLSSLIEHGEDFIAHEQYSTLEQVQLSALAKFGDEATEVENIDYKYDDGRKGRYRVKASIANEDVKITKQNVLRGIRLLEKIGNTQNATRVDGIAAWEADLTNTFLDIQKQGIVKVGHNIPAADIPWANQAFDMMSQEAQDYYFKQSGGKYLHSSDGKTFDLLSLARMADATNKLTHDITKVPGMAEYLKDLGHTPLQQETLAQAALGKNKVDELLAKNNLAAHTAAADTNTFNFILTEGKIPGKKESFVDKLIGMAENYVGEEEISLAPNVVMNAKKSLGGGDYDGIIGYTIDPLTGKVRTSNGIEVSKDGKVSRGFGDTVVKGDVSYMLSPEKALRKISAGDEEAKRIMKAMGVVDSRFTQGELYELSLDMLRPDDVRGKTVDPTEQYLSNSKQRTFRGAMQSKIIGSKEMIQQFLNKNMIAFAEVRSFNQDDSMNLMPIGSGMKQVANYDVAKQKVLKTNPMDVIERGFKRVQNDSMNRAFEEMDYKKIKKFASFHDILLDERTRRNELNLKDKLSGPYAFSTDLTDIANDLIDSAKRVQAMQKGLKPEDIERLKKAGEYKDLGPENAVKVFDLFKYDDPETRKPVVDFRTYDRARASIGVMEHSGNMLKQLLGIVEDKNLGTEREKEFLFKQMMSNIYGKWSKSMVDEDTSKTHASANKIFPKIPAHQRNKIELTRSGFMKSGNAKVVTYNEEERKYTINMAQNPESKLIREATNTLHMRQDGSIKGRLIDMAKDNGIDLGDVSKLGHREVANLFVRKINDIRKDDQTAFMPKKAVFDATGGLDVLRFDNEEIEKYAKDYVASYREGTLRDLSKIMKYDAKAEQEVLIKDIVNNFMMAPEMDYEKYGYTKEQAAFLSNARELRKKDYEKYAETMLRGAYKSGANLYFDKNKGILGLEAGGEFVDLSKIVARDKHYNGVYYTEVGGNKIRNGIYLDAHGMDKDIYHQTDIQAKSNLGKAMGKAYGNIDYSVKRAIEMGQDPVDAIKRWMKDVNSVLRQGPSVDHFDEKDMKSQSYINVSGAIDKLGKIKGVNNLTSEDQEGLKELIMRAQKSNWSYDKMSDSSNMFMQKSLKEIMQFLSGGLEDSWVKEAIGNITGRAKSSTAEDGYYESLSMTTELEDFNKMARQIDRQNSFITYDEAQAAKILKTAHEYGDNNVFNRVGMGANLRTSLGAARDEMLSDEHMSRRMQTFELMRASFSPQEFMERIASEQSKVKSQQYDASLGMSKEAFEEDKAAKLQAFRRLAAIGNITEGAGVMNGRVAEAFLQGSDLQMKAWTKDLFTKDDEMIADVTSDPSKLTPEKIKRIENLSNMHIDFTAVNKGENDFKLEYGKGFFVKHGETIAQEYSEYGSKFTNFAAKYDGVVKVGFFTKDKGHLVAAEEAASYLKEQANKKNVRLTSLQEVMEFAKEFYTPAVYVDKLDMVDYRKLQEDNLEKHMTATALEGLGRHDDALKGRSVNKVLDELGLSHLSGRILDQKYFEELKSVDKFKEGVLAQSVGASAKDYEEAIKAGGFKDEKDFRYHIERERYMSGDLLHQITGADVVLQSDDVGHGNAGAHIKTAINNMHEQQVQQLMAEQGATERTKDIERKASEMIVDKAKDAFHVNGKDGGLYVDKNGRVGIAGGFDLLSNSYVDTNKLEQVYNDFMPQAKNDPRAEFKNLLMTGGNVTRHGYNLMNDVTSFQGTGATDLLDRSNEITGNKLDMMSGLKMTDRELSLMSIQTYNDKDMERIRNAFGDDSLYKEMFSHALNDDMTLKSAYQGKIVMGDYLDEMRRNQYFGAGDKLLLDHDGSFKMEAPEEYKRAAQALQEISGGRVSIRAAEEMHSVASNRAAIQFNRGMLSEDFLTSGDNSVKFKQIDLKDLVTSNGKDGGYALAHPDSIFNKNLLINLDDEHLHGVSEKLGRSQLAIGMIPTSLLGDEVLTKDVHAALNSIVHARQNIIENGQLLGEEGIQRQKDNIVEKAKEVNAMMDKITHGKGGTWASLNSVRVNHSAYGKAMLMDMPQANANYNDDLLPFLGKAEFGGRKMRDFYDRGINLDVKVFGMQHAERMGLFDQEYLDKIGATKEEVIDRLERGVMGLTERFPAIYEGSKSSTTFVLDRNLGSQVIESAAGLLTRKGDADGDQPASEMGGYTDKSGRHVTSLEYALKGGAKGDFAPEVHEAFANQQSSNIMNAVFRHEHYQGKLDKANAEAKQIYQEVLDKAYKMGDASEETLAMQRVGWGDSAKYSDSGRLYGALGREASPEELGRIRMDQDELHTRTLSNYARQNNLSFEDAQEHMMNKYGQAEYRASEAYMEHQREAINATSDDSLRQRFEVAARYDDRFADFKAAQMGSLKRGNAGQINLAMAKLNKLRLMSGDMFDSQDQRMFVHVTEAAEEGFLSPKHASKEQVNNAALMDEFDRAFRAASNNPMQGDEAGSQLLKEWLHKNATGRLRNYNSAEEKAVAIDRAADMVSEIFSRNKGVQEYNVFLNALGQYTNGVGIKNIDMAMEGVGTDTFGSQTSRALANAYSDIGHTHKDALERNERIAQAFNDNTEFRGNSYQPPTVDNLKLSATGKLDAIKNALSGMSGKKLAVGAGIAAGVSLLGSFVGGNPSKPASTHAATTDGAGGYEPIPLADGGGNYSQVPQGNGYVVNVNAQSGQSQRHAEEAIRNAMRNASGGNVNISMTTRNEYGNLDAQSVTSLLTSAFS